MNPMNNVACYTAFNALDKSLKLTEFLCDFASCNISVAFLNHNNIQFHKFNDTNSVSWAMTIEMNIDNIEIFHNNILFR